MQLAYISRERWPRLKRIAPDALALSAFVAVLIFFYWQFSLGRAFMWDDTLTEFYPGVNYFAKSISAGRFPLWFAGVRDGIPFYSDPQLAIFYPPQWLLVPFVRDGRLPFVVFQCYIVLHYILGGGFMYAFLKRLRLGATAALAGALVFSLCGFACLRIVNFVMIQVYVWLPLQLLCVHELTKKWRIWTWVGLIGAMLMSVLAGHPQTTIYCWYMVGAYWLYQCYADGECDRNWKTRLRALPKQVVKIVGTFVLVVGLAATALLPVTQNWLCTTRPRQSFETVADPSLPWDQLLSFVVPRFFGESRDGGSPQNFWGFDHHSPTVRNIKAVRGGVGYWQYWEFGAYSGQVFCIALLLVLFNPHTIQRRLARFFVLVWFFAVWFMLGKYGGLFQLLYYSLPGASMFRGPAKMSCVAACAAALVTAEAIELLKNRSAIKRRWPALIPLLFCISLFLLLSWFGKALSHEFGNDVRLTWSRQETLFALIISGVCGLAALGINRARYGWQRATWLMLILVSMVIDFHHVYGNYQQGAEDPDVFYPKSNDLLSFLETYPATPRPFRFAQIIRDRVREELTFPRNLAFFHDFLEVPEGYTTFYLDTVSRFQSITNRAALLGIQNVAIATERDAQGEPWLDLLTNSLPRAKFFTHTRPCASDAALLEELDRGAFDWHKEVGLTETVALDSSPSAVQPNQKIADSVKFESRSPEEYSVEYNVSSPGIIFVSRTFYPGWLANDGHVKIVRVFGAFQGLVIPHAGHGRIIVRFSPRILKVGLGISLMSLGILALIVSRCRKDFGARACSTASQAPPSCLPMASTNGRISDIS